MTDGNWWHCQKDQRMKTLICSSQVGLKTGTQFFRFCDWLKIPMAKIYFFIGRYTADSTVCFLNQRRLWLSETRRRSGDYMCDSWTHVNRVVTVKLVGRNDFGQLGELTISGHTSFEEAVLTSRWSAWQLKIFQPSFYRDLDFWWMETENYLIANEVLSRLKIL